MWNRWICGKGKCSVYFNRRTFKTEYRGYDSAGIAVLDDSQENKEIEVIKAKGRLQALREMTDNGRAVKGCCGIGHTRWATHGAPSDVNSHPHFNTKGTIAVVHNGIIENYLPLKKKLESRGYQFVSETDTEVLAHMLDYYYNEDPMVAITKVFTVWKALMPWESCSLISRRAVCGKKRQPPHRRAERRRLLHRFRCPCNPEIHKNRDLY